jgi:hypothetical protein
MKGKGNSRFIRRMTERKARARAKAKSPVISAIIGLLFLSAWRSGLYR